MRQILLLLLIVFSYLKAASQVAVNTTNSTPHPSAMLDVSSTEKGLLIPRMSNGERGVIPSPARGLLVFTNEDSTFWCYDGTNWVELVNSSASLWKKSGNNIYNTNTQNIGIGTTPSATIKLSVAANANAAAFQSINNYPGGPSSAIGVYGQATASSNNGTGGYFWGSKTGVYAKGLTAGTFEGNVQVIGTLSKSAGSFKIDHPQDPVNKYLVHSFVESPDMLNVYNGNITTDAKGGALVQLPTYFEAENVDFKYGLTVIGQFAQAIIAEEVHDNTFTIKTDKPNVKVSWQVTGVRNDAYAQKYRLRPEVDKGEDRGKYLHPDLFHQPMDKRIGTINSLPVKE